MGGELLPLGLTILACFELLQLGFFLIHELESWHWMAKHNTACHTIREEGCHTPVVSRLLLMHADGLQIEQMTKRKSVILVLQLGQQVFNV